MKGGSCVGGLPETGKDTREARPLAEWSIRAPSSHPLNGVRGNAGDWAAHGRQGASLELFYRGREGGVASRKIGCDGDTEQRNTRA